jgi:hypothetical protein
MATALSAVDLRVPADQVWKLIGGFGALPDWLPCPISPHPSSAKAAERGASPIRMAAPSLSA